jgi:hypothetical protein
VPDRVPEEVLHRGRRGPRQLADRPDTQVGEALLVHRAHSPDQADGERVEEGPLGARCHDDQAVRLGHLGGDLREVLGPRGADRDGEPDLGPDALADPRADRRGRAEQVGRPGHVEERLVDRDPLDRRCDVPEDRHHGIAEPLVLPVVTPHEDELGAQPGRPPAGHPALHPVRLGLVGGREHHSPARPAPDGDRPSAQRGIEQLLDRRVERVEVGVQDRGTGPGHDGILVEHAFDTPEPVDEQDRSSGSCQRSLAHWPP